MRRHSRQALRAVTLGIFVVGATLLPSCSAESGLEDEDYESEPTSATEEELRSGVSCAEKSVTGYKSGTPYAMKVVTVGGKPTAKATAHAFLKFQAAADAKGVSLSINSGFRSNSEQTYLYNCYKNQNCNNGNLAAKPGYSNHQNGRALDLATSNWTWVSQNASRFGFRATVARERWHYEYSGADPGGPCSGSSSSTPSPSSEADEAPAGGGCHSATLDRVVGELACVQAESNGAYYQCKDGKWYRGVTNGSGPYGACSATHPL